MEKQKSPLIKQILLFVIVFCFAFWGTKTVLPSLLSSDKVMERRMKKEVDSINKTLPKTITSGIRAENIEIIDDHHIQCNMTIADVDDASPKIYKDALRRNVMADIQKYYNEDAAMKAFKERNVNIKYFFMDAH